MKLQLATTISIASLITGCSYMSERFEAPKPRAQQRTSYEYSNPAKPRPQPRYTDDVTTEAMPRQAKGKVTDAPPLLECKSNWCLQNCDPEMMPKPKACIYYKVPR